MGFDLGKAFGGIAKFLPLIVQGVVSIEQLFKKGEKSGQEKEDKAVDLVTNLLPLLEGAVSRDVVDDKLVQEAMRDVMKASVKLMNVVNDVKARKLLEAKDPAPGE